MQVKIYSLASAITAEVELTLANPNKMSQGVLLLLLIVFSANTIFAVQPTCEPGTRWNDRGFQQPFSNSGFAFDMAIDKQGFAYIAGYCRGTSPICTTTSTLDHNLHLYKVNLATQQVVWSRSAGFPNLFSNQRDIAHCVAIDESRDAVYIGATYFGSFTLDGITVTNRGASDSLIARFFMSNGTLQWVQAMGGPLVCCYYFFLHFF